ncbi:MAG: MBL fold metallo-hydrolase [Clostridia bacterium]|nr:MBL fold metallo-hydrolase [Clostridia bacterium]
MINVRTVTGGLLDVNTYILESDGGCLIVDPGTGFAHIQETTSGKPIQAVLLTHGHIDHIIGLGPFIEQKIPIYIHEKDREMLSDPEKNLSVEFGRGITFDVDVHVLRDGEHLQLIGEDIEVISTPGHTPGSVCFRTGNILISGDTLFAGSYGRTDFPGGSMRQMVDSLCRLKALPGETLVYPGHGRTTTIAWEQRW